MPPLLSDSDDTKTSLPGGEMNANGNSTPPLFECIPLSVSSQICHNILSDLKDLQTRGHLPSDREFRLTESFGICLEGISSKEEAAVLETKQLLEEEYHDNSPCASDINQKLAENAWIYHEDDLSSLRHLMESLCKRPHVCHYAFNRAENMLRDLSYLAQNSSTLNCYHLGRLIVRTAYEEFTKDMATARSLPEKLHDQSFWDGIVSLVSFLNVMARLVGCDPDTFEQADMLDRITAISPQIGEDYRYMRLTHEYASIDHRNRPTWSKSLAFSAKRMAASLYKMERGLQRAMELYLPTSDNN